MIMGAESLTSHALRQGDYVQLIMREESIIADAHGKIAEVRGAVAIMSGVIIRQGGAPVVAENFMINAAEVFMIERRGVVLDKSIMCPFGGHGRTGARATVAIFNVTFTEDYTMDGTYHACRDHAAQHYGHLA